MPHRSRTCATIAAIVADNGQLGFTLDQHGGYILGPCEPCPDHRELVRKQGLDKRVKPSEGSPAAVSKCRLFEKSGSEHRP